MFYNNPSLKVRIRLSLIGVVFLCAGLFLAGINSVNNLGDFIYIGIVLLPVICLFIPIAWWILLTLYGFFFIILIVLLSQSGEGGLAYIPNLVLLILLTFALLIETYLEKRKMNLGEKIGVRKSNNFALKGFLGLIGGIILWFVGGIMLTLLLQFIGLSYAEQRPIDLAFKIISAGVVVIVPLYYWIIAPLIARSKN